MDILHNNIKSHKDFTSIKSDLRKELNDLLNDYKLIMDNDELDTMSKNEKLKIKCYTLERINGVLVKVPVNN